MGNLLCSDDNRTQGDHEEGAQNDIEPPKEVDASSPRSVHSGDENELKKEDEKKLESDKTQDKEEKKEKEEKEEEEEDEEKEDEKKKEKKKDTKPKDKVSKLSECEFSPCLDIGKSSEMAAIEVNSQKQISITNKDSNNQVIQCYLGFQQARSENLIIRLRLNNEADANPKFSFGLMDADKVSDTAVQKGKLSYEESSEENGNISKILKGKQVAWAKDAKKVGKKELEIRINIEKQILKVASYPKYENVVEINKKELIDSYGDYNFVVQIGNKGDSITVFDVSTVDKFDNLM